ncbi:alpha/beta hydrolase [soil metagenome]
MAESSPSIDSAQAVKHMVLVHGAWQGSWAFDAWSPLLEAKGWTVHAVDLPGNGWPPAANGIANLATFTDHVASLIRELDAPVVLVGHSGGGITVSQVAETIPDRIVALVYLAGMMLPSGLRFVELISDVRKREPGIDLRGISEWLDWSADRSSTSVRTEGALQCFLQDCDPDAARQAASLLRPQPETGRDMRNHLTAQHFGSVRRIYVECLDDRSVLPALQRRMQELVPGALRITMTCGHVPQLACPQELTERLLQALG